MGGHNNFYGEDFFGGGFFGSTDLAGTPGAPLRRHLTRKEEEVLDDFLDRLKAKVRKKKTKAQVVATVEAAVEQLTERAQTPLVLTLKTELETLIQERMGRIEVLKAIERMQDAVSDEDEVIALLLLS